MRLMFSRGTTETEWGPNSDPCAFYGSVQYLSLVSVDVLEYYNVRSYKLVISYYVNYVT